MSSEFICAAARAHVTERCGYWLLVAQQPINRPGWWKGKFTLFQIWATWGWTSVQRPTLSTGNQWARAHSTVSSDSHLQTDHRRSDQHRLALGTVFSSRVHLSPFIEAGSREWGSSHLGRGLATMWSPSSTWCSTYTTAHRLWLRILSVVLGEELKVLDYA